MQELTGAQVLISSGDAGVLEDGGQSSPYGNGSEQWKPVKPDRVLHDGEQVQLGDVTLFAHATPGMTKGCTTWTTVVEESGKKYSVVVLCGLGVGDNKQFVGNPERYPDILDDYRKTFAKLKSLPCDIYLGVHAASFGLMEKMKRMKQGTGPNPFIDPLGFRTYVDAREPEYLELVEKAHRAH